jgi:hypothetical protein
MRRAGARWQFAAILSRNFHQIQNFSTEQRRGPPFLMFISRLGARRCELRIAYWRVKEAFFFNFASASGRAADNAAARRSLRKSLRARMIGRTCALLHSFARRVLCHINCSGARRQEKYLKIHTQRRHAVARSDFYCYF